MKMVFLIMTLLSIISTLNMESKDFDLINGISQKHKVPLEKGSVNKFYVKASQFQKATFTIHIDYTTEPPLSNFNVYEYSNRNSTNPDKEKNISVSILSAGGGSVTFSSYNVELSSTNYIAFELKPTRNISYFDVQIEVTDGRYDLSDGESKNITNTKSGDVYYFFIEAKEQQKINFTLTTNYINSKPFTDIYIYEYQIKEDLFHRKKTSSKSISPTKINNELISSFSYIVSNDDIYYYSKTNYLVLKLVISNISYLTVKIDNPTEFYDLKNGIKETFYNLKADASYYFYSKAKQNQNVSIKIETNMDDKPFTTVNFYELEDQNSTYRDKTNAPISFTKRDNISLISASCIVKNEFANYILLNIKPLYDIKYITIQMNSSGNSYDMSKGLSKNITNLISGAPYTFYMNVDRLDIVTISFTMNNFGKIPFTDIYVFEQASKHNSYLNSSSQPISFLNEGNQIIADFSYQINHFASNIAGFKITPNFDIDYMVSKIDIEKCLYELNYNSKMYNLKVGIKYYLFAYIYGKKEEVTFTLTMDDMNIPFNSINIYEVDSYFYDSYLSKISKDVSTKKNKDKLVLSFSYKALNTRVSHLLVEFCPKYNIKYLEVNFSNNNSRNSIYIAGIADATFNF